jgi:RsiW-degrading membrane proteinase PrsW (M82 family)
MASFRIVLGVGAALVVGLAALGWFPVALVAAAALVPLVMVLYLLQVDLYEGEPLRVMVLTILWGAVAGVALGLVTNAVTPGGVGQLLSSSSTRLLTRAVILPLAGLVLALGGPLFLLRYRKFNDVLDGVTFGAASAVCLAGAQALVRGYALFSEGLRPGGAAAPWVFRMLSLGVLIPVLWSCSVGIVGAALWLRYRAPVRDRAALGPVGRPVLAVIVAAVLLVTASVLQLQLRPGWSFAALLPVDLVALILLRRAIHLGLLEESLEMPIGPPVTCPNCGKPTPRHTFCINCGIALSAMPKGPDEPAPDAEPSEEDR